MLALQENYSLCRLNTLNLASRARYYCRVASPTDLREALGIARQRHLQVLILGQGSNLVLAGDIDGLVIGIAIRGIEVEMSGGARIQLTVGGGEDWHGLVRHCLRNGWYGLENLSLIPGTVGAAPVQNIGAYGLELSERFVRLQAMDLVSGELVTFCNEDCEFGYRDSVFKGRYRDRYAICSVTLALSTQPDLRLAYPTLRRALADLPPKRITPQVVSDRVCDIRRAALPDPVEIPNAGSFFKNPLVTQDVADRLRERFPDMVMYRHDGQRVKLAAGWLIEQAGWKGHRENGVGVYDKQALVLTHTGSGDAAELLALAGKITADIERIYGVVLEIEPRIYGNWKGESPPAD